MKQQIEIKDSKERREMAATLFDNGYTVRKAGIQKPTTKTKITVLAYGRGFYTVELNRDDYKDDIAAEGMKETK